ncbi:MAG: malonyl-CoA decarboxylase [Magnetospirillum sp.]|nr:malonyl-CoA decarboxylase [Magnetospirillum sp.]
MTQPVKTSLLARIKGLATSWREVARAGRAKEVAPAPDLPDGDRARLRERIRACLQGRGGEVSARARAAALGRDYLGLNPVGRRRFLLLLAEEFGPDRRAVDEAIEHLRAAGGDPALRAKAERALRAVLEPPRVRLLTQFNGLPEGVEFLVDMRAELLALARADPALAAVEADLKGLLAAWFDVGFLELARITWRSPASVLEKIMAYEAVHVIEDWEDLKNRLDDSDRRLFAFFHPRMPDEPLIFLEVALTRGMTANIRDLLDPRAPAAEGADADTAMFYSITNAQKGLAGISFGSFLIKRVVEEVSRDFERVTTFATLSPLPGFRPWLEDQPDFRDGRLGEILRRDGWHGDPALAQAARGALCRLAARYLVLEKRPDGKALDPVAHFHLSNGARLERLDWLADTSPKGLAQSSGVMVNYVYEPAAIEANHEAYAGGGGVAMSAEMRALLKG